MSCIMYKILEIFNTALNKLQSCNYYKQPQDCGSSRSGGAAMLDW